MNDLVGLAIRGTVSELRAAIDANCVARHPPCLLGGKKDSDSTDVVRLCYAFERLHAKGRFASRVRFGEARHFSLNHTRSDGVDANALRTKRRCEVLHHCVDSALGRRIGREIGDSGVRRE